MEDKGDRSHVGNEGRCDRSHTSVRCQTAQPAYPRGRPRPGAQAHGSCREHQRRQQRRHQQSPGRPHCGLRSARAHHRFTRVICANGALGTLLRGTRWRVPRGGSERTEHSASARAMAADAEANREVRACAMRPPPHARACRAWLFGRLCAVSPRDASRCPTALSRSRVRTRAPLCFCVCARAGAVCGG